MSPRRARAASRCTSSPASRRSRWDARRTVRGLGAHGPQVDRLHRRIDRGHVRVDWRGVGGRRDARILRLVGRRDASRNDRGRADGVLLSGQRHDRSARHNTEAAINSGVVRREMVCIGHTRYARSFDSQTRISREELLILTGVGLSRGAKTFQVRLVERELASESVRLSRVRQTIASRIQYRKTLNHNHRWVCPPTHGWGRQTNGSRNTGVNPF